MKLSKAALGLVFASSLSVAAPPAELSGDFPTSCGLWAYHNDESLKAFSYVDPDSGRRLIAVQPEGQPRQEAPLQGDLVVNGKKHAGGPLGLNDFWIARFSNGPGRIELSGQIFRICSALTANEPDCEGLANKSQGLLKMSPTESYPVTIYNGCQVD